MCTNSNMSVNLKNVGCIEKEIQKNEKKSASKLLRKEHRKNKWKTRKQNKNTLRKLL